MTAVTETRIALPKPPSKVGPTIWSIVVGLVIVAAAWGLGADWAKLLDLPRAAWEYAVLMFQSPDWSRLPRALFETWRSISMAWLGAILCVVLSVPLGMLAARGTGPAWLRYLLRGLFAVIRAFPEVIIALILLTVTGLTPFTGMLALGIAGIGTQGKWVYETIESLDDGSAEAVQAAGGGRLAVLRWALWPAALPSLASFALYRFEINIRTSAVLGLVGAGGVGEMLSNYTNYREWSTVGMLLTVVIVATMLVDLVSGALRRRIMEGAQARGMDRSS
ncbi:phosphonate ABC transporter, permease protein PhnE [Microbacterium indicum]|uniref:phosphonate ABC transporter, permease protein PhnE n=1 Tax=Microbacterium indicum TaxID=358100 RepID=UPI00040092B0|nr:phosphonate ABC transporter, permease protein PhnE [Microbacterium indicum]